MSKACLQLLLVTALVVPSSPAAAQTDPRLAAAVNVGGVWGSDSSGAAAGGTLLLDVNPRVSLEVLAEYLDRGRGADAFAATASLLVNVLPATNLWAPYIALGGGVYHVSFDLAAPRFLGRSGAQFPAGSLVCPAPGAGFGLGPGPGLGAGSAPCPASATGYWGVGALPRFYARRLGPLAFPPNGAWETRAFTDPTLTMGGGLRFQVTDHLMLRPDARALVILADGDTHTIAVFAINVAYRF